MQHLTSIDRLQPYRQALDDSLSLGFVPTMGNLHAGHLSLIERARSQNDRVVVSIFVNPLQFGPQEDFQNYPRTLERDLAQCREAGVDAVFTPTAADLGIDGEDGEDRNGDRRAIATTVMPPPQMTALLCGRSRPGHFEGVATIVTKLLNLVRPRRAYFGQKDAQQLAIVRRLVRDLNLPVEIVGCPIVRESDGLACSSRNRYLSPEDRDRAPVLYRSLQAARDRFESGVRDRGELLATVKDELARVPELRLDYVELVDPERLLPLASVRRRGLLAIAARLGDTRLIDNLLLHVRQPVVAIDGPAGAGKSTVTRQVAERLGLLYLDTGAMYRAVTWYVLDRGLDPNDDTAIAKALDDCHLRLHFDPDSQHCRVWVNQQEVTQAIRSPRVTANVSAVAALPCVRQFLVQQQQDFGASGGLVAEGRDMGTHVFPNAELKIFLTASVAERARRRKRDLEQQGYAVALSQLEGEIAERDRRDSSRVLAPLQKAQDAIEIQTDDLSIEEVVERIVGHVPGDR